MYSVKEIFLSIQGEGHHAGRRAVFVRLAGCNLWTGREEDRTRGKAPCALWCDTQFRGGRRMSAEDVSSEMVSLWRCDTHSPFVVITGGEPALQFDQELLDALHARDAYVAMETNGTVSLRAWPDWVCISPKISGIALGACDEVKVVHPTDIAPLDYAHLSQVRYVQPLDSSEDSYAACADFVLRNPAWRVGPRLHSHCRIR